MALKAKPPRYKCTVCGYESASQNGIKMHIYGRENADHDLDNPKDHIEFAKHEALSLTELVQEEFGGCERIDRIADHPYWSEQRIFDELTELVFENHVETFTHGDYRFIKVVDEE